MTMSNRLGKIALVLGSVLLSGSVAAVDTQTVQVEYTLDKGVQAVWEGGDTVGTGGGNGRITLDSAAEKVAMLQVQCNSVQGYEVSFQSANPTGTGSAKMLHGGVGGSADKELTYNAVLDVDAFRSTATIVTEALDLQTAGIDVKVKFDGVGDVLPTSQALANEVKLRLTMAAFDPFFKEEGLYSDTITAVVEIK